MKLDMYLMSNNKDVPSELNYLLITDGENWYYKDESYIGNIIIDGGNINDVIAGKHETISNEIIAERIRKALKTGNIDPIHDFIFDCIASNSDFSQFKGYTIDNIMNDSHYRDWYFWHIGSEYICSNTHDNIFV